MRTLCQLILFTTLTSSAYAMAARVADPSTLTTRSFRAGAYAQDITPQKLPIVVNGNFGPIIAEKIVDPLHVRCLILDDNKTRIGIAAVDSCLIDRELMDQAKELTSQLTGLPVSKLFISTTHTHTAPAATSILGTELDPEYRAWLPHQIAAGFKNALDRLEPAEIGWAVEKIPNLPQSRRWIARPDKLTTNPFGEQTTRANMHPGHRNPNWQEPSGPINPDLDIIALRRPDGSPIALYGSFSIHYVGGVQPISADYFGVFCNRISELLDASSTGKPFVGILANGVSGDIYLRNYTLKEQPPFTKESIAEEVAQAALKAYQSIKWHPWLQLDMLESEIELNLRKPKLEWAQKLQAEINAGTANPPKSIQRDIYMQEQFLLAQMPPTRKLKLQTIRIGTLAMTGIPTEVYALTGLRIAAASPFEHTFTVMLANGCDGYMPPPEQMVMGGYNTWLARSSCLENNAEPKVINQITTQLKKLAGNYRHNHSLPPPAPYRTAVLQSRPTHYWQLDDLAGPGPIDSVSNKPLGAFGMPTAYYMPGAQAPDFPGFGNDNRTPHFIGSPLSAKVKKLKKSYSIELWFYNCMPNDARDITGYLFAVGNSGDRLAISGTASEPGKLFFCNNNSRNDFTTGQTTIPIRNWVPNESWHHLVLVRDGNQVTLYLDGKTTPELNLTTPLLESSGEIWIGGTSDGTANFEGRIDEVAIYHRPLSAAEVSAHFKAAYHQPGIIP